MDARHRWRQAGWALPWLLFQLFPIVDLVVTPRPAAVRVGGRGAARRVHGRLPGRLRPRLHAGLRPRLAVAADRGGAGVALPVWLGTSWAGLLIYVSAAATAALPQRWVWPAVLGAAAVCTAVVAADGLLGDVFILPVMCLLTAFALQGTRHLISVNAELVEARDELARNAVAQERLRFARDLHDLLGPQPVADRAEERARRPAGRARPGAGAGGDGRRRGRGRRALAEVRDAVSGYRQVSLAQALAEARSALSPRGSPPASGAGGPLPGAADAVLGWVVREATTNVLRHSGARTVTVDLVEDGHVTLSVTDDGAGAVGATGAGLSGLRRRVGRSGAGSAAGRPGAPAPAHRGPPADRPGRPEAVRSR